MLKIVVAIFLLLCVRISTLAQTTIFRASCEPVRTDESFGKHENDWALYLKDNINTMIPVTNCAPAGRYYVEIAFLVAKDGKIEYACPRTRAGYGMEEELMRVIRLSPPWTPATQNGRNCRAYRCQTFIFEVSGVPATAL